MTDAKFWHERWKTNQIPFHEPKPHRLLVKFFGRLGLAKGTRIFVPLCGKSLDIGWLLARGCRVAGAELSEIAVKQLFAELGLKPKVTIFKGNAGTRYSAKGIDIFVGDIFAVSRKRLGPVDGIYDRAALVALPEAVRKRYGAHLRQITNGAPQLLIAFEYDQRALAGPPFSISNAELVQRYGKSYNLTLLASAPLKGGLKGTCPAFENVWLLQKV